MLHCPEKATSVSEAHKHKGDGNSWKKGEKI